MLEEIIMTVMPKARDLMETRYCTVDDLEIVLGHHTAHSLEKESEAVGSWPGTMRATFGKISNIEVVVDTATPRLMSVRIKRVSPFFRVKA